MTDAELLKLCEKATPEPWVMEPDIRPDVFTVRTVDGKGGYFDAGELVRSGRKYVSDQSGRLHVVELAKYDNNLDDGRFIAAAREALPRLIAEKQEMEKLIADLKGMGHADLQTLGDGRDYGLAVFMLRDSAITKAADLLDLAWALSNNGNVSRGDWEGFRKFWWAAAVKVTP